MAVIKFGEILEVTWKIIIVYYNEQYIKHCSIQIKIIKKIEQDEAFCGQDNYGWS